jgi:hypothetical protein
VGDDGDIAEIHGSTSTVGQWLERDLAGKPGPSSPDRTQKPGIRKGASDPRASNSKGKPAPKKETRPTGPGTPYSLRRNILRKHQKTMGCSAFG